MEIEMYDWFQAKAEVYFGKRIVTDEYLGDNEHKFIFEDGTESFRYVSDDGEIYTESEWFR